MSAGTEGRCRVTKKQKKTRIRGQRTQLLPVASRCGIVRHFATHSTLSQHDVIQPEPWPNRGQRLWVSTSDLSEGDDACRKVALAPVIGGIAERGDEGAARAHVLT
jgi:hypothetical protein